MLSRETARTELVRYGAVSCLDEKICQTSNCIQLLTTSRQTERVHILSQFDKEDIITHKCLFWNVHNSCRLDVLVISLSKMLLLPSGIFAKQWNFEVPQTKDNVLWVLTSCWTILSSVRFPNIIWSHWVCTETFAVAVSVQFFLTEILLPLFWKAVFATSKQKREILRSVFLIFAWVLISCC